MVLEKVVLPVYSKGEEIFNSVSHALGVPLGVLFLILGIYKSTAANNLVATFLFALSTVILYACSMLYHSLKAGTAKKAMRLIDHSAIFIMIVGTATALNIIYVFPHNKVFSVATATLSIVLSIVGIALTFIDQEKYMKVQMILYMVVGYTAGCLAYPIFKYNENVKFPMILVLIGGILYTVGTVFYKIGKKKKYFHCIFHVFILGGTAFHFAAIYLSLS